MFPIQLQRVSVDEDLNTPSTRRAVVGDTHVLPRIPFYTEIGPYLDGVDLGLVGEPKIKTLIRIKIFFIASKVPQRARMFGQAPHDGGTVD